MAKLETSIPLGAGESSMDNITGAIDLDSREGEDIIQPSYRCVVIRS